MKREPNAKELNRQLTDVSASITGMRHCSNCRQLRKEVGGTWITMSNGTRRRWSCAECISKIERR
jgi:hypothetical protein